MAELKNGEFGVDMEKEKILWTDRKRHTIFALPISFTKYTLTETKLIIQKGFFNLREDEIQLYRVRDLALSQSFLERIGKEAANTGLACRRLVKQLHCATSHVVRQII